MGFIIKQETKKSRYSWKTQPELYEIFLIEIGQLKETSNWLEMSWEYTLPSQLKERFITWKKQNNV